MSIGCSVILYNSEGKVLIAQRGKNKKLFPLMWENIGGHLEGKESPEECIKREAHEEIGCYLNDLKLFSVTVKTEANEQFVLIAFTGRILGEVNLQGEEIAQVRWITRSELDQFEFCFNCRQVIDEFFKKKLESVFLLQHSYEIEDDYDETKMIGIYSSGEMAEKAVERLKSQPGFQDHPDDFHIDEYEIDKDHWTEGFFTTK